MKTKFLKHSLLLIFATAFLASCSPEDGKDGATGPEGPQGEQGIQGEQGEQGETGTANAIYSDWITSEFPSIAAAEQSQQLLVTLGLGDFNIDRDLIMVYGKNETNILSDDIIQLPYEHFSQDELYRYRLSTGNGFIALYAEGASTDGGNKIYTFFEEYRYVIIPGEVSTSEKRSLVDYSKMSYKEIVERFNIPE